MPVEMKLPLDEGGLREPAIFANRVQVAGSGQFVRFSFAETYSPNGPFFYRAAILMMTGDAKLLAETILSTIAEAEKVAAAQMEVVPQSSKPPAKPVE